MNREQDTLQSRSGILEKERQEQTQNLSLDQNIAQSF